MNVPEEIPTPFPPSPGPDVTDITVEQERANNIAAAMRKINESSWSRFAAEEELESLNPTPDEIMAAIETWKVQ